VGGREGVREPSEPCAPIMTGKVDKRIHAPVLLVPETNTRSCIDDDLTCTSHKCCTGKHQCQRGFSKVPRRRARARERESEKEREGEGESLRLGLWGKRAMASGQTEYCLCPWGTAPLESVVRGRYIGLYWDYIS
jgi:hypothetical protein